METTKLYKFIMEKKMEATIEYCGYIGDKGKKMETTIMGLFRA